MRSSQSFLGSPPKSAPFLGPQNSTAPLCKDPKRDPNLGNYSCGQECSGVAGPDGSAEADELFKYIKPFKREVDRSCRAGRGGSRHVALPRAPCAQKYSINLQALEVHG